MVDKKKLDEDDIKDSMEEMQPCEEVKDEEQDLEAIKKVLEEALSEEKEASTSEIGRAHV